MNRCSPFLWLGVGLQATAVLLLVAGWWYVGEYVTSDPVRMSSKGIAYTPQSVHHLRIVIVAGCATWVAAILCLVGLLHGPRHRRCLFCGIPSIALVSLPVIALVLARLYVTLRHAF